MPCRNVTYKGQADEDEEKKTVNSKEKKDNGGVKVKEKHFNEKRITSFSLTFLLKHLNKITIDLLLDIQFLINCPLTQAKRKKKTMFLILSRSV